MSRRNYWTIYDDDTRDWESERETMEREPSIDFGEIVREHMRKMRDKKGKGTNQPKKIDHFTQDDDLFEV